jgi:uncharacterized membrane protein YkoI
MVAAALALGVWTLFWDPLTSDAAPTISADVGTVTSKLEALHHRTAARTQSDDDDIGNQSSWGHVVTPEQAAMAAQRIALARGDGAALHNYIELQTRNGRPVYQIRIGSAPVYIDADTGAQTN